MPITPETVITALHARRLPHAAIILRDEVRAQQIAAAGSIILPDGQPGEPEVLRYHYRHRAALEVVIQAGPAGPLLSTH